MKTKIKKIVPKIQAKIKKIDGSEITITTEKKRRIYSNLKKDKFLEVKIKVAYLPGLENSGMFMDTQEAAEAIRAWTEKELIKHILEGEW